ncbi:MAG: redoxin domain-containing protein [Devosiaceae bacterium]|nr:redoxin domain-containing protein [Devosiaceae bacterium]
MPYNYTSFSSDEYDLSKFAGPHAGDKAPDATFTMADGSSRQLLDFDEDFLVIEMGSVTCPLFQSRRKTMAQLSAQFKNVKFVVLYVREAHPGAKIRQHEVMGDKYSSAQKLDDGSGDLREVLVDDIEGHAHKLYGSYPNAVFVVNKNGCVVFTSDWNDANATGRALKLLLAGKPANVRSFFKPALPKVGIATFKRSGKGSALDFFKGLPVLFWQNMIKRNWRVITGKKPRVAPDSFC